METVFPLESMIDDDDEIPVPVSHCASLKDDVCSCSEPRRRTLTLVSYYIRINT